MRCIGRKSKNFARCKNDCKFLFCGHHKLQWWGVVVIIATLGGLFQDIIFPLFKDEENVILQNERDSLNSIIDRQNQVIDKQVKEFEKLQREFENVKDDIISALQESKYKLLNREDVFITQEENSINATLKINQKFFLGEYRTKDIQLREVITKIEGFFQENNISSNIQVEITGSADGSRPTRNLFYMGEFGDLFNETYYHINEGETKTLTLQKMEPLSNESIAFLRAYNIKYEILKSIRISPNQIHIQIMLSQEMGPEFREFKVEIKSG